MSVHYKFKSNLEHDTVTFDGLSISVADLKKSIMHQKKIGKSSDFDLQITNAQTKEVYDNDEMLVPKNTSVIVARIPVSTTNKKSWDRPDLPLPIGLDDGDLGQIRYDRIAKNADLVNANTTEEDKVKAMITQSSQEYDPSKYVKSRSMTGPLPPTYTCFRCGKHGHWIKDCPTNNPDVKRSTGIPRSFMVPVDGPEHRGALLTSSGEYAVPLIDHHAYKEVKKEKPPFVPQEEQEVEIEAQIPEELLCMLCRDLLQDAVLIPCCGNSFCDECVRQVLLDSDNHECPLCHETQVSPDTVIPNRFLRTAVLNYKNETGYTRVKRPVVDNSSKFLKHVDSPQPSPDSTVETHPMPSSSTVESSEEVEQIKEECPEELDVTNQAEPSNNVKTVIITEPSNDVKTVIITESSNDVKTEPSSNIKTEPSAAESPERTDVLKDCLDAEIEDMQPGTPLADEPSADMSQSLPIQAIGQETFPTDRNEDRSDSRYQRHRRGDYDHSYSERRSSSPEKQTISTISTISNVWNGNRKPKYMISQRPTNNRPFQNQRHYDDRADNYGNSDREEYPRRRYNDRPSHRPPHNYRDYRASKESRYHDTEEYSMENVHQDPHYDNRTHIEENIRRRPERYASPPRPVHVEVPVPQPVYSMPTVSHMLPPILSVPQTYPMQPPPPGSSPIDTSQTAAQPPPPGVGPLIPPTLAPEPTTSYTVSFDSEDPLKEPKKLEERSIDDRLEAFQRELERKRERKHRVSRSRSRSVNRARSRSLTRSFSSSKSWTRSPTRSSTRTTRSHSRTPFSSRSRSRSYTRSRTRSWSKPRSYTRSRSRARSDSRSRSRSRNEPRIRRRGGSRERDRLRSPPPRSRSHSYSPRDYRAPNQRSSYHGKRIFTPPRYGSSYHSQFSAPSAPIPIQIMRQPNYPPHVHEIHTVTHPIHTLPAGLYPIDRPRYESYSEDYQSFDAYSHNTQKPFPRQTFERGQRTVRYDKRQEYQQRQEEVLHPIPERIGDRSRENKPRYRPREQRKEIIKELPKVSDYEMKPRHVKEIKSELVVKKKEEKVAPRHKKHHHHHKIKESKKQEKQENKIPVIVGVEKHSEVSQNLIHVEKQEKIFESVPAKAAKVSDKTKEKKHKHKKHKLVEQPTKKKKTAKKEKLEAPSDVDIPALPKLKTKKKKVKVKNIVPEELIVRSDPLVEHIKKEAQPVESEPPPSEVEKIPEETTDTKPLLVEKIIPKTEESHVSDTLDIFADDTDNETTLAVGVSDEPESAEVAPVNSSTEFIEENLEASDITEKVDNEEAQDENSGDEEEEDVLHVDVPALSKWEREEFDDVVYSSKPQRRSTVIVPKEGKGSLSSDIIQRAEKAILSKPLKTTIVNPNKEKTVAKSNIKEENISEAPVKTKIDSEAPLKAKDISEIKSVVNAERAPSPILQVTISTVKERRSVRSKKDQSSKKLRDEDSMLKRVKLDRSSFKGSTSESSSRSQRTVTVAEASFSTIKNEEKQQNFDYSHRSSSRREGRRYSAEREAELAEEVYHREKRDRNKVIGKSRDSHYQGEQLHRSEKRRYEEYERIPQGDSRERRRVHPEYISRDRRHQESVEASKSYDSYKKESYPKHLHSESYDSSDSYYSGSKKVSRLKQPTSSLKKSEIHDSVSKEKTKKTSNESPMPTRKHSPIKAPEPSSDQIKHKQSSFSSKHFTQDIMKFEPDYDEFSDVEIKRREHKKKLKRTRDSSDGNKKHFRQEVMKDNQESLSEKHRVENSSSTSSSSSSALSDSDSSDSEPIKKSKSSDTDYKQRHKKSHHKKHKKHKHKHKKKKSHKSK